MANKAILITAGLGLAAYQISETLKERQVEEEAKEVEQRRQDRREELQRRLEEAERKQKGKGGSDVEDELNSTADIFRGIDDALLDMLQELQKRAERTSPPFTLPLLSSSNKPDEILLGSALALGDEDVVKNALSRIQNSPGLGVTRLSRESVALIRDVIRDWVAEQPTGLSNKILSPLMYMGLFHKKAKLGEPTIIVVDDVSERNEIAKMYELAEQCGFYFAPLNRFRQNGASFTVKSSRRKDKTGKRRFEGPFILSNVNVTKFGYRLNPIQYSGKPQPLESRERTLQLVATRFAAKRAAIASERLLKLDTTSSDEGISFEHIAAYCGYGGDLLRHLEEGDIVMLTQHKTKVASTLESTLLRCVPSPDRDIRSQGPPTAALRNEVNTFIGQYLQLLHLAYYDIPRIGGRTPSHFVCEQTVSEEADTGMFSSPPRLIQGTIRSLELLERERLVRSREIVAPGVLYTATFLLFLCLLMCWLSHAGLKFVVQQKYALPMSLALGLWAVDSFLQYIKKPLHVHFSTNVSKFRGAWMVSSACTEFLGRRIALLVGSSTPFEKEMTRLKNECQHQYKAWSKRIALREYYVALSRKRITYSSFMRLLDGIAEDRYSRDDGDGGDDSLSGRYQEVTLPGSSQEAEEFLAIEFEEDDVDKGESKDEDCLLAALHNLGSAVTECLHFSVGDRVVVEVPPSILEGTLKKKHKMVLAAVSGCKGSVVDSWPGIVMVHVDGYFDPLPVPSVCCTLLETKGMECICEEEGAQAPMIEADAGRDDVDSSEGNDDVDSTEGTDDFALETKRPEVSDDESKPKRARTVEEALEEGGWKLVRGKKHKRYRRMLEDGRAEYFSMAKTPSDVRASKNALSTLRKLNAANTSKETAPNAQSKEVKCCLCSKEKPESAFTKNQLRKKQHKCKECVRRMEVDGVVT